MRSVWKVRYHVRLAVDLMILTNVLYGLAVIVVLVPVLAAADEEGAG